MARHSSADSMGRFQKRLNAPTHQSQETQAHSPKIANMAAELQRSVGNRVTSTLMSRGGVDLRTIRRFEGKEHKELGDATKDKIDLGNGVVLPWGTVVALAGDEFGSYSELVEAAKTDRGKATIYAAIAHDKLPNSSEGGVLTDADQNVGETARKDIKADVAKRYLKLAERNVSHFAAGGTALESWRHLHIEAIQAAKTGTSEGLERAKLIEAFGQHFLTDMFSGGHIRTPRASIISYYDVQGPRIWGAFADSVAKSVGGVVPDVFRRFPEVASYVDQFSGWIRAGIMSVSGDFSIKLAGLLSGTLHDKDGRVGVMVSSEDHPDAWRAFGDDGLASSPISKQQAEKAVLAARNQLIEVHKAANASLELKQDRTSFPEIERFIPSVAQGNAEIEGWKWGELSVEMVAELNVWLGGTAVENVSTLLDTLRPSAALKPLLDSERGSQMIEYVKGQAKLWASAFLKNDPAKTIGAILGQQPGKP